MYSGDIGLPVVANAVLFGTLYTLAGVDNKLYPRLAQYYHANVDETRRKIKELIENNQWDSDELQEMKKKLLENLNIQNAKQELLDTNQEFLDTNLKLLDASQRLLQKVNDLIDIKIDIPSIDK